MLFFPPWSVTSYYSKETVPFHSLGEPPPRETVVDVVLDGLRERAHRHVSGEGGGGRGLVVGLVTVAPLLLQVGVVP